MKRIFSIIIVCFLVNHLHIIEGRANMSKQKHRILEPTDLSNYDYLDKEKTMILTLMGEINEDKKDFDFLFTDDSSKIEASSRSEKRRLEKEREKRRQFTNTREKLCDKINYHYDAFAVIDEALSSFSGPHDSIEYQQLMRKYCDAKKKLSSSLTEYNNTIRNSVANFVLYRVNKIISNMLISRNRDSFFENPEDFSRNRLISLHDLFNYLLTLGRDSTSKELFNFFRDDERSIPTVPAMIQQRHKLKPEGVKHLFETLTQELCRIQRPTVNGYRVLVTDGTDTNLWRDENAETFVEGKQGEKGYNQYHIVTIGDAGSGVFMDAVIQPRPKMNETKAATEMVKRLKVFGNRLLLADRGFASFNLIQTCKENGICPCFRVRENFCKETNNLPLEECDIDVNTIIFTRQTKENKERIAAGEGRYLSGASPYGKNKKSQTWDYGDNFPISFRVVRFKIGEKKGVAIWETIITTLPRDEFPIEEIKKLYRLRWNGVEGAYKDIKYDGNLSYFHCKNDDFVRQEIYARLTMSSICRTLMNLAAYGHEMGYFEIDTEVLFCEEEKDSKSDAEKDSATANEDDTSKNNPPKIVYYQINHSMAYYIIHDFVRNNGDVPYDLCAIIRKFLLPVRPNRRFEMKVKPQSFNHFWYR